MRFSDEPAVYIAVIDALLILGVTFGLPLTPEQKGGIDAMLAALAGVFIRSQVTPTAKLTQAFVANKPRPKTPLHKPLDTL